MIITQNLGMDVPLNAMLKEVGHAEEAHLPPLIRALRSVVME
jgi:hypothetical protein